MRISIYLDRFIRFSLYSADNNQQVHTYCMDLIWNIKQSLYIVLVFCRFWIWTWIWIMKFLLLLSTVDGGGGGGGVSENRSISFFNVIFSAQKKNASWSADKNLISAKKHTLIEVDIDLIKEIVYRTFDWMASFLIWSKDCIFSVSVQSISSVVSRPTDKRYRQHMKTVFLITVTNELRPFWIYHSFWIKGSEYKGCLDFSEWIKYFWVLCCNVIKTSLLRF